MTLIFPINTLLSASFEPNLLFFVFGFSFAFSPFSNPVARKHVSLVLLMVLSIFFFIVFFNIETIKCLNKYECDFRVINFYHGDYKMMNHFGVSV